MKDITEIIPFGKQEPEMSKLTKQLYVKVQHQNPIKKINYTDFLRNIKEHCKIHHFDWTCRHPKTNRRVYPSLKGNAIHWCKNYDYPGAYRIYAEYMNGENELDLLLLEKSLKDFDIRLLFEISQDILNEIKSLPKEPKYEYRRKASIETYVMIMNEIRKRLEIDEENINIKSENTNNNLNVNITDEEVLDENEDTFERFIRRRMRKADETDK